MEINLFHVYLIQITCAIQKNQNVQKLSKKGRYNFRKSLVRNHNRNGKMDSFVLYNSLLNWHVKIRGDVYGVLSKKIGDTSDPTVETSRMYRLFRQLN